MAFRDTLSFHLLDLVTDVNGRFLIVVATVNNITYTLVTLYAPNTHQQKFIRKVMKKVRSVQRGYVLLCGDFNITMDPSIDSTARTRIKKLGLAPCVLQEDFHDPWRCMNPTGRDFTFFSNPHSSYSRIDYFLVDRKLLLKVSDATIDNISWSDHAPVSFEIADGHPRFNTSLWRNNTFLLADSACTEELKVRLQEFFFFNAGTSVDIFNLWCAHKAFIRGLLIQMNARVKRKKTQYI